MISITEQELKDNITKLLSYLLNKKDILENQILIELPDDVKKPFINMYTTYDNNKGIKIPVLDTFPSNKTENTFVLIQFEASTSDNENQSLGSLQGDVQDINEGNVVQENLSITTDNLGNVYVTPSKPFIDILNCIQTTVKSIDKKNNRVYLDNVDSMLVNTVTLIYTQDTNVGQGKILPIGLNLIEKISVDFISNNMSVLKCMYAIMLYMQAYLRLSLSNNGNVYLPDVEFKGNDYIAELNGNNANLGQQMFYRRLEITYKTTQTINIPTDLISLINVRGGDNIG